jgi:antitoxin PrlF
MIDKASKQYAISPAKIGSQDGFRLPRAFSKDYPELIAADGYVEVLSEDTLIVRLNPVTQDKAEEDEGVTMSLFLDFLMKCAIENPDSLVSYTAEMSREAEELIDGVKLDED